MGFIIIPHGISLSELRGDTGRIFERATERSADLVTVCIFYS